jgi:hypothetical protein
MRVETLDQALAYRGGERIGIDLDEVVHTESVTEARKASVKPVQLVPRDRV